MNEDIYDSYYNCTVYWEAEDTGDARIGNFYGCFLFWESSNWSKFVKGNDYAQRLIVNNLFNRVNIAFNINNEQFNSLHKSLSVIEGFLNHLLPLFPHLSNRNSWNNAKYSLKTLKECNKYNVLEIIGMYVM